MGNGRDANGRFVKGHRLSVGNSGGGRPPKAREERYHEILLRSCSFTDWRAIVDKAVWQALRGDKDARRWLTDYLVGPAAQTLKLDANVHWAYLLEELRDAGFDEVADAGAEATDL